MINMDKVLITGGEGLVGSTIEGGIKVGRSDADLTSYEETERLFELYQPEYVIHLAAVVGGILGNIQNRKKFFRENLLINFNVLDCADKYNVKKVVCGSSTCVFPGVIYPDRYLREELLFDGPPNPCHSAYAWTKRFMNIMNDAYKNTNICCYFSNLYGPDDSFDLVNGHVIPSLIHKCYLAMRDNTDFVIWGTGKPKREAVYSKDVGRILPILLEKGEQDVLVSSNMEYTIKELATMVCEEFSFGGNIVHDTSKPDGQFQKCTNTERLRKVIGDDFEFTTVKDGLKETINWFKENYPYIRGA